MKSLKRKAAKSAMKGNALDKFGAYAMSNQDARNVKGGYPSTVEECEEYWEGDDQGAMACCKSLEY